MEMICRYGLDILFIFTPAHLHILISILQIITSDHSL